MRVLLDQVHSDLLVHTLDLMLPVDWAAECFANERVLIEVPLLIAAEHIVVVGHIVRIWTPWYLELVVILENLDRGCPSLDLSRVSMFPNGYQRKDRDVPAAAVVRTVVVQKRSSELAQAWKGRLPSSSESETGTWHRRTRLGTNPGMRDAAACTLRRHQRFVGSSW